MERRFLLEQKWGLRKTPNPHAIPKYVLRKYLPDNVAIIDCGAHVGADSVELARIFRRGKVYSFEPVPALFQLLVRNSRKYSNIHCYQLALGNMNGTTKMFVSSGGSDGSSSLLPPTGHLVDHPDVHFKETTEARTITLDAWAAENNIQQIDFLWLDMQGFEFQMLQASTKILPTVKAIHTEVSTRETYKGAVLYGDLKQWLGGQGFEVVTEAIPPGTDMGNVLFVRKSDGSY